MTGPAIEPADLTDDGVLRCPVAMGPAGDDTRRCEREALPMHRTHLVDGVYHLPGNEVAVREAAAAWIAERTPVVEPAARSIERDPDLGYRLLALADDWRAANPGDEPVDPDDVYDWLVARGIERGAMT